MKPSVLGTPIFAGELARPRWFYRQWMLAGNPAYFFEKLSQDFGDFVHYRGLFQFYLINHPSLVKQLLQETHHTFNKQSVIYDRFRNAFGNGLVVAEGDRWKRQRKMMQPMFGPVAVRRFFDLMLDCATSMTNRWDSKCRSSTVFDIANQMDHLTLEIAGRSLFHNGFDHAAEQIGQWTKIINHYSAKPPLPIVRSFWFPSRTNTMLKTALREFHQFLSEMIAERRKGSEEHDLLSILLNAKDEETGEPMSDVEIGEEVLGMIIGGHETSSSALAWVWHELHRHPEVETKLHAEIDSVIGKRALRIEDLPLLKYTKMVLDEVLRLHPPFWFENRNAACDTELGGIAIPKGSLVVFSRYSLHRHPDFWNNPNHFLPERFEPEHEDNKRSTYASVPFGGGPRICIGINFAMLELIVVLAVVAQRFRVVVDSQDRHQMSARLTMTPQNGVKVRLIER